MQGMGGIFHLRFLATKLIHQPDELVGVLIPDLVQSLYSTEDL